MKLLPAELHWHSFQYWISNQKIPQRKKSLMSQNDWIDNHLLSEESNNKKYSPVNSRNVTTSSPECFHCLLKISITHIAPRFLHTTLQNSPRTSCNVYILIRRKRKRVTKFHICTSAAFPPTIASHDLQKKTTKTLKNQQMEKKKLISIIKELTNRTHLRGDPMFVQGKVEESKSN